MPFADIWRQLGLPRGTVAHWFYGSRAQEMAQHRAQIRSMDSCPVCTESLDAMRPDRYAYLLGQYLGDGHLATGARVPVLRVYCTADYPDIIDECGEAMRAILARSVSLVPKHGCVAVQSYSMHWPCVFPQHGPGPKHRRPIVLEPWQQEIADAHPRALLRGLIHADGCRVVNRVTVRGRPYAYPRYLFANESGDILRICGDALDRIGADWRYNRPNSLSVARRGSVALLDCFIGPKT